MITNLSKSRGGAFIAALRISNILKKIYDIKIIPPDIDSPIGKLKYFLALFLKRIFIGKTLFLNSLNIEMIGKYSNTVLFKLESKKKVNKVIKY